VNRVAVIAVNAPFSQLSSRGEAIARGVELAVDTINKSGGVTGPHGETYTLRVKRYDDGLSARTSVANVRHAIADHAVAIVDEGTGVDASWQRANAAGVPICIVYEGAAGLVDPKTRPNVFRIVPTDHGIAFRFAEYLAPRQLRLALVHDDSEYGLGGEAALDDAFSYDPRTVAVKIQVSADASDLSAPVLKARRAGATGLLVWGGPATIAAVVRAARRAGWQVPIYAPPAASDPLVRQELSDHPEWLDGLTFADGRLTAEVGPAPFYAYLEAYEAAFGADTIGVKTAAGRPVVGLPEYSMYASDFVNVLAAAMHRGGTGRPLIRALNEVTVRGANGDERGFNDANHEGVVDDDVYFARFHDMTYRPVKDDPLSSTLPALVQVR
jgi:ABC-type branched-subunit amino acid transport system substrate-binding protein